MRAPARLARSDGTPVALPPWLDRLSDRWWGLTPRVRTASLVLLALAVVLGSAARTLTAPLGPPTTVLVAARDLPVGTRLDDEAVRRARWPSDLVPTGALTVAEGTLTAPLPEDAVATAGHVTTDGIGGVAGPGRAVVPLPVEYVPDLPVGTRVRIVAADVDGAGRVVADGAEVVAADGTALWLALPDAAAAGVAAAGLRSSVALVVLPPQ